MTRRERELLLRLADLLRRGALAQSFYFAAGREMSPEDANVITNEAGVIIDAYCHTEAVTEEAALARAYASRRAGVLVDGRRVDHEHRGRPAVPVATEGAGARGVSQPPADSSRTDAGARGASEHELSRTDVVDDRTVRVECSCKAWWTIGRHADPQESMAWHRKSAAKEATRVY